MTQAQRVPTGRRARLWLAAGVLSVSLVACAPVYRNHGYIPSDPELAQISLGASRDEVATAIGRPSASGLLHDQGWFYVQSRWRHYGARPPEEVDRQVVAVTFSEAGLVSNIERFGLERGQVVPLSRRVTETNIQGIGVLRQLMGSVGQMRADQLVD